jgi:prevent-host-death family protein
MVTCMSERISTAEAKAKFSELIDRAAAGEEIVVTRSGKPRARIVPLAGPPKRPFGIAKHWKIPPDEVLFAPMSEEDVRWSEGFYQQDNRLYYTKADLVRIGKQRRYKPPRKAKKTRTRRR